MVFWTILTSWVLRLVVSDGNEVIYHLPTWLLRKSPAKELRTPSFQLVNFDFTPQIEFLYFYSFRLAIFEKRKFLNHVSSWIFKQGSDLNLEDTFQINISQKIKFSQIAPQILNLIKDFFLPFYYLLTNIIILSKIYSQLWNIDVFSIFTPQWCPGDLKNRESSRVPPWSFDCICLEWYNWDLNLNYITPTSVLTKIINVSGVGWDYLAPGWCHNSMVMAPSLTFSSKVDCMHVWDSSISIEARVALLDLEIGHVQGCNSHSGTIQSDVTHELHGYGP